MILIGGLCHTVAEPITMPRARSSVREYRTKRKWSTRKPGVLNVKLALLSISVGCVEEDDMKKMDRKRARSERTRGSFGINVTSSDLEIKKHYKLWNQRYKEAALRSRNIIKFGINVTWSDRVSENAI